ncbi:cytochrome c oxidase subunit 4 [Arthrobacter castelli]|uniref:cytochrome c oxidase subunit 4 n=1 Tax=Arthrobacter castelli TaxID=271431 RepID=UPI000417BED4|nr:cytochrome c oxidase subunit 4 [Arthrobacter castelli]
MKVETYIFGLGIFFFLPASIVYGFMTGWAEWVGIVGLLLITGLCAMIGFYLGFTGRRVGARPEDRMDGEIHEGAGEQGHFSPWSWWPLALGMGAAMGFLGLAVGWWIVYIGSGFTVIALIGWVYEYSRGSHAH